MEQGMATSKTSKPQATETSSLIATTREALLDQVRKSFELKDEETNFVKNFRGYASEESPTKIFSEGIIKGNTLSNDSKLNVARYLAAERIVLNALGNMYRAIQTPTPEERFTRYFMRGLSGPPTEQKHFAEILAKAKEKMIINVVQTMHPTIYHTEFGRTMETKLTTQLETIATGYKNNGNEYHKEAQAPIEKAKETIADLAVAMKNKQAITPNQQVTVAMENELDHKNHLAMQTAMAEVVESYNSALKKVLTQLESQNKISAELADQMRKQEIKHEQIHYRTWAYGADADGRDQSTSIVLWDGIHHQIKPGQDNKYISRRRDLRENAKDQKECVSALIQHAYRISKKEEKNEFSDFCDEFIKKIDPSEKGKFTIPAKSTVLQLSPAAQAEFFKKLLVGDYDNHASALSNFRLTPASLAQETIAFNKMFFEEYRNYIREKRRLNKDAPIPDLHSLDDAEKKGLAEWINKKSISVDGTSRHVQFNPDTMLYSVGDSEKSEFPQRIHLTNPETQEASESRAEPKRRRKLLDVIKRLLVLNDAVERYGDRVADRYQVANFENEADFYSSLLLFKEAGIVEVDPKTKKISKAKLSLQPLLETEDDQERAPTLFRKLLQDDLVLSYYEARGNHAKFMVGYSDGAKSAGNMASEWSIYKCTRELKKVFQEKGIDVSFFHGRGRGDSRGGQFDEGQNFRATPYEVRRWVHDETSQADAPMNGAISAARGKDTATSMILGVLTGQQEAEKNLALQESDNEYNKRIDKI